MSIKTDSKFVNMKLHPFFSTGLIVFVYVSQITSAQEEIQKPKFPDVFQIELQGIFLTSGSGRPRELDGTLYYDKRNNRAALVYTYQNMVSRSIYNFNNSEISYIVGSECTVSAISSEVGGSFFPFTVDSSGKKKILAQPEDIFFFSNSTLDTESLTVFPSYVYKAKMDFPQYKRTNCDVLHIFSKPELELPTCDTFACQPTLLSISVKCPSNDEDGDMSHVYNFFRFRTDVIEEVAFQPPVGVHCNTAADRNKFPDFPEYYSFSYDLKEKMEDDGGSAVYSTHKKIWFDSQLKVIRMDEFDDDGLLTSSRVFDFWRGTAYTIVATSTASCVKGPIEVVQQWDQMTRLPKLFFMPKASEGGAVYVGMRKVHGFDYHVWSSSSTDTETDAVVVEEFYFTNNIASILNESYRYYLISHVDIYTYERNDDTNEFELSVLNYLPVNHFRSKPKEWEAYDVASCFKNDQRKSFTLDVEGPPVVRNSYLYEEVLELLYMNLIRTTKMSVVRISELTGIFDGVEISGFYGWILAKSESADTKSTEPDMNSAYQMIQEAAEAGTLSVSLNWEGKKLKYVITPTETKPKNNTGDLPKPTFPDVFSVEVQGILQGANGDPPTEMEGTIYYDSVNKKTALVYTFQNQTTNSIYKFDDEQLVLIEGYKCSVSDIEESEILFFPFAANGKNGGKVLATPEELFYFTNSVLDRQEISVFPYYVYAAKVDFPQYGHTDCDVTHVFSKPEVELPTCEGHACKPTLMSIAIRCQSTSTDEDNGVDQVFNFFRFRSTALDRSVFQSPVGVHCPTISHKPFPLLPPYFSFSYDLSKEQEISGSDSGVYSIHKKIWYESKVNVIRMDEIDDDGLLTTTRIFDYYGGTGYTIITSLSDCESFSPIPTEEGLDQLTRLPKILFSATSEAAKDAVYVGKRNTRGLDYEVWSISTTDEESYTITVEDLYFTKNIPEKMEVKDEFFYQISHADIYTYVRNEDSKAFELSLLTHISINNFRSKIKEWEAFDVSLCFKKEHRKGFKLKLKGPPIVKESHGYHDIFEQLLMKLINTTQVNILRINELQGIFDGSEISEFTGWILDKSLSKGSNNSEPDMNTAFDKMKEATGNLIIHLKKDNSEKIEYILTSVEPFTDEGNGSKSAGYSGTSMAGMGLACLSLGFIVGIVGYYVFLKKRRKTQSEDRRPLTNRVVELINM